MLKWRKNQSLERIKLYWAKNWLQNKKIRQIQIYGLDSVLIKMGIINTNIKDNKPN